MVGNAAQKWHSNEQAHTMKNEAACRPPVQPGTVRGGRRCFVRLSVVALCLLPLPFHLCHLVKISAACSTDLCTQVAYTFIFLMAFDIRNGGDRCRTKNMGYNLSALLFCAVFGQSSLGFSRPKRCHVRFLLGFFV